MLSFLSLARSAENPIPYLVCTNCGAFLNGDPDEDPTGDGGKPLCGECERNRNPESMLEDQDSRNRHR